MLWHRRNRDRLGCFLFGLGIIEAQKYVSCFDTSGLSDLN